ncbi:hypothetical protein ABGN05_04555 [Aquibium sp. LZ166]|uniref:Uncharacterized protein n=1 Tax=Aquibium pacificus TaxID=3153579 RepID=A0ABV3SEF8_9HYPH
MSFQNVKAHAIAARAEKDIAKKLDMIACALEELAKGLSGESSSSLASRPEEKRFFR